MLERSTSGIDADTAQSDNRDREDLSHETV